MSIYDQILARFANQVDRSRNLRLVGPADALVSKLPQPVQTGARGVLYPALGIGLDVLDTGLDAASEVSKYATGAALQGASVALDPGSDARWAVDSVMAEMPDANPLERMRAINERFASRHPYATGAANMLLDPTNLITPGAEEAGLISKAAPVATRGRGLATRLADFASGAGVLKDALGIAHEAGKEGQAAALAGKRIEQVVARERKIPGTGIAPEKPWAKNADGTVLKVGDMVGSASQDVDWERAGLQQAEYEFWKVLKANRLGTLDALATDEGRAYVNADARLTKQLKKEGWVRLSKKEFTAEAKAQGIVYVGGVPYGKRALVHPVSDEAVRAGSLVPGPDYQGATTVSDQLREALLERESAFRTMLGRATSLLKPEAMQTKEGRALLEARKKVLLAQRQAGWGPATDEYVRGLGESQGLSFDPGVPPQTETIFKDKQVNVREKLDFRSAWNNWKQAMVLNGRNLIQDILTGKASAKAAGIPSEEVNHALEGMVVNSAKPGINPQEVLPGRTSGVVELLNWDSAGAKQFDQRAFDPRQELGMGVLDATAGADEKFLHPLQSASLGAAYSLANPLRGGVPVLGVAGSALSGYFRAYQNEAFSALSHIIQTALRSTGWDVEFGQQTGERAAKFLAQLDPQAAQTLRTVAAQNYDLLSQAGENMSMYSREALLSAKQVTDAAGPVAGALWADQLDEARQAASAATKHVFGDFSPEQAQGWRTLDYIVPFLSWTRRAYPRAIEIAAQHPSASLALHRLMEMDQGAATKEGRPDYTVGTIPIDTETPVVGAGVRALLGGRSGEARVDALRSLAPIPAGSVGGDLTLDDKAGLMDNARNVLEFLGVGLGPLPELLGYASGQTNKLPRAMSRTAGIEGALPGPTLPSALNGPLNALRKAEGKSQISDPVIRLADELVFERTGKPLSDASNKKLALELEQHGELYQAAKELYDRGAATRAGVGWFDPLNVSTTSDTGVQAGKAQAGLPLSRAELQALAQDNPDAALLGTRLNAAYKQGNPAAAVYDRPALTKEDKQDPRLTKWELEHRNLKFFSPTLYAASRAEYMQVLGI